MRRRVVITGMGAVTPIGIGVEEFWAGIQEERIGFGPITSFDASGYKCRLAAQVKGFEPEKYMDKKAARRMEPFCRYAVAAAGEAMADAGLDMEKEDAYRIGCCVGSGIGSLQAMEREYARLTEKGPGRVSPLFVPMMISNMAAGNVSIAFGLKGKSLNVVTACASGTHSIGEAFRSIQYGELDACVAGGAAGAVTPLGIAGFCALNALSESQDPRRCSIPFDKDRSGFVMGEGAGIVVLEELEHAKARGAHVYGEVLGYGCSDAYHITSPAEDGSGAARAMSNALEDGGIRPEQLTYINAHGTATHLNDLFETRAIKLAFGSHAANLKINSTKSMMTSIPPMYSTIVEFIACAKQVQEGYIHRTVGLLESEEELDLNYCRESYREQVPYALSNSLGFGGHNASILMGRYE